MSFLSSKSILVYMSLVTFYDSEEDGTVSVVSAAGVVGVVGA